MTDALYSRLPMQQCGVTIGSKLNKMSFRLSMLGHTVSR